MNTPEDFMRYCLELGKLALENGNPPVGAVLVHGDEIIGEGIESGKTTGDNTNHAEILAVRDVIANGNKEKLPQSTMYSTHEPCIMCSYLIRTYNISTIVYSSDVDDVGGYSSNFSILKTDCILKWGKAPLVIRGILKEESLLLSKQFEKRFKKN